MPKHTTPFTPGPYYFTCEKAGTLKRYHIRAKGQPRAVAVIECKANVRAECELALANARLLTAAPELWNALQKLVLCLSHHPRGIDQELQDYAISPAQSALKLVKARPPRSK